MLPTTSWSSSSTTPEQNSQAVLQPDQAPGLVFTARLRPGGASFAAPNDQPLLKAAENAGIAMASSCRNGTCRSCICKLIEGEVTYRIEWPGLSAEEKAAGFILPCVAFAASDLVLQFPF